MILTLPPFDYLLFSIVARIVMRKGEKRRIRGSLSPRLMAWLYGPAHAGTSVFILGPMTWVLVVGVEGQQK